MAELMCPKCGGEGWHAEWCSAGQRPAEPHKRCEGDAVAVALQDGAMLVYCGAGGPWSHRPEDEVLPLATEACRLVERHDAECPGAGR